MKSLLARALLAAWMALCCAMTLAQTRVDLQGHRGARGLLPENTLAAFERAIQLGVTTLELDVVLTKDEVLVVSHDPRLNPDITRGPDGRFLSVAGPAIVSLSYQDLMAYDVGRLNPASRYWHNFSGQQAVDGQKIPRLKDVFDLVKASGNTAVKLAIETKITPSHPELTPSPERLVQLLLKEIRVSDLSDRVQILSFDWRTLQLVQRQSPGMPTVYLTAQLPDLDNLMIQSAKESPWTAGFQYPQYGSVAKMIKAAGGTHWSSYWRELDVQKVSEAHQLGLKVLAWTVNDPALMNQMIDLGVDGLVTDRPDLAIEVLKQRKVNW